MDTGDEISRLNSEQQQLEEKLEKLKDEVRALELMVNSMSTHLDLLKTKMTSFDSIIGWIVKLFIAAIIGGFMTFLLKGGLVL